MGKDRRLYAVNHAAKQERKQQGPTVLSDRLLWEHTEYTVREQYSRAKYKKLWTEKQTPTIPEESRSAVVVSGGTTKEKPCDIQHEFLVTGEEVIPFVTRDKHSYKAKDFVPRSPNPKNHPAVSGEVVRILRETTTTVYTKDGEIKQPNARGKVVAGKTDIVTVMRHESTYNRTDTSNVSKSRNQKERERKQQYTLSEQEKVNTARQKRDETAIRAREGIRSGSRAMSEMIKKSFIDT